MKYMENKHKARSKSFSSDSRFVLPKPIRVFSSLGWNHKGFFRLREHFDNFYSYLITNIYHDK